MSEKHSSVSTSSRQYGKKAIAIKARLENNVLKDCNDCWNWIGWKDRDGYGKTQVKVDGKWISRSTHRISYEEYIGPIPDGLCVLHKCDNPSCINPKHLWVGTNKDNTQDAVKKRRMSSGEHRYNAKLNHDKAAQIRERYIPYVCSISKLAKEFCVSKRLILLVIQNKVWA